MSSESNVSYLYESLGNIIPRIFKSLSNIQIIPCIKNRETDEIFALLGMTSIGIVTDLGNKMKKNNSLSNFISQTLKINTLGLINLSQEYIENNTNVAYATCVNVETGEVILHKNELPIFFVNIDIDNIEQLNDLIMNFREKYKHYIKKTIITNRINITNLIYMDSVDLFLFMRGGICKVEGDSEDYVIEINIEEEGFPAIEVISEIYKAREEIGEIPITNYYNENANCCPEVFFYMGKDDSIRRSILKFFEKKLEILM